MSRRLLLTVAVVAGLVLGGCDRAGDIEDQTRDAVAEARSRVDDARRQLDDVATQAQDVRNRFVWCRSAASLGRAVAARDADRAADAAEGLRTVLPEDLLDELGTVVAAVARAQGGDTGALLDEAVTEAAHTLLTTTIETCGLSSG